jgi:hypothetical protein
MDFSGNLHEVMFEYSRNIREYNNNMKIYLDIIAARERSYNREHTDSIRNRFLNTSQNMRTSIGINTDTHTVPRQSEFLTTLLDPFIRRGSRENIIQNLQNVIVRPTTTQILYATEIIVFDESMSNNNTTCPITLDPFENGEEICRIKHCSHLFKRRALHDWFRQNVRCPICRFDIRDYHVHEEAEEAGNDEDVEDVGEDVVVEEIIIEPVRQPIVNPFTRNFTSAIRSFVNNELANLSPNMNSVASDLLYTFDIPLTMDLSGNFRI